MGTIQGIPVAQLAIFLVLFQPSIYVLFKHGRRGVLGWICIQSFCLLRIVGGILQIIQEKNNSASTLATLILSSIGISPLLFACLGILHEARRARNPKLNNRLEWLMVIKYHGLVIVAMVLLIIGIVRVDDGTDLASKSIFIKIGFALIFLSWGVLMAWALFSLRPQYMDTTTYAPGTLLLYAVIISLCLLLLRLIYGVCYFFITDSSFDTSIPAKVVLSVVPEMIVVSLLVLVGLKTANMWKENISYN